MSAAFSFGSLGAMADMVVAPSVAPEPEGVLASFVTPAARYYQRPATAPRTWAVSRPWQDPTFARMLGVAGHGLGGPYYLYDRACARQNMVPRSLSAGAAFLRRNLASNPSFEAGMSQGWGTAAGGSATVALDTAWADTGTQSVKISGGTASFTSFYPLGLSQGQMDRVGFKAGATYTIGATVRLTAAQTGSLDVNARGIVVSTVIGGVTTNVYAASPSAPNAAGATRLVLTFTVPVLATNVYVRLMNGSTTQPVWWDSLTFEEGVTDGSYFSGDTADGFWEGTANASPSQQGVLVSTQPMGPVTWPSIRVPLLAGRAYTVSAWTSQTGASAYTVTLPNGTVRTAPAPTGGLATVAVPAQATPGFITITRAATALSGVRVHEGAPDGLYYATQGTPCRVAVESPGQAYQLVTDTETRIDYTVSLHETGRTGYYT